MASLPENLHLNHIARETFNLDRLAAFYQHVLGFEVMESPQYEEYDVVWLRLPSSSLSMHLIRRKRDASPEPSPESPFARPTPEHPRVLPGRHHVAFSISNFDAFVLNLKEKGVETFQKTQPDGKTKQVFFYDPDGNGLEVTGC